MKKSEINIILVITSIILLIMISKYLQGDRYQKTVSCDLIQINDKTYNYVDEDNNEIDNTDTSNDVDNVDNINESEYNQKPQSYDTLQTTTIPRAKIIRQPYPTGLPALPVDRPTFLKSQLPFDSDFPKPPMGPPGAPGYGPAEGPAGGYRA